VVERRVISQYALRVRPLAAAGRRQLEKLPSRLDPATSKAWGAARGAATSSIAAVTAPVCRAAVGRINMASLVESKDQRRTRTKSNSRRGIAS